MKRICRINQQGFSLIEVLIALAVLAFALTALMNTAGSSARNTAHLQEKTFAHWAAMNKMAELRLTKAFPKIGIKEGKSKMVGREWRWEVKTQETPEKSMRRVDVRVRRLDDPKDTSLALVTGFLSKQ